MVKALVTGGAGFIGSHVVDELLARGATVVVVDNLSPAAHSATPGYLDSRVDYRFVDVTDIDAMTSAVSDIDLVSHQAARVGLGVDFGDVTDYVQDNDVGTAVLLNALWRAGFTGRLVVASSMVVYGEGAYRCHTHGTAQPGPRLVADLDAGRFDPCCGECGATLEPGTVFEDARLDPRNVYAATKLHTEHLAWAFGRESGASVAALRYHNVYGPRMPRDTPYAGVASIFRSVLESGGAPLVTEDGCQRRDFVHVTDVARANVAALLDHPEASGPFNIASGSPHTVLDLAQVLAGAIAPGPEHAPQITSTWRTGDVRHVVASPQRAAELLGFKAQISFAAGMAAFARDPLRA